MYTTTITTITYNIVSSHFSESHLQKGDYDDGQISPQFASEEIRDKIEHLLTLYPKASGTITVTIEIEE